MRVTKIFILFIFIFAAKKLPAQDSSKLVLINHSIIDSSSNAATDTTHPIAKDSVIKVKHDPHKATIRSAILPGWGQAYNREYWKIPIVYAAIGIPAGLYIYNNKWYKKSRDAYNIVFDNDTAHFGNIDPKLQGLSAQSLQYYRNQFRRDRDYSVLYFLLMYGLNIVDATVFGHLKDFDVSDDLSMHINPQYNPLTKTAGLGFVFNFKTPPRKQITLR